MKYTFEFIFEKVSEIMSAILFEVSFKMHTANCEDEIVKTIEDLEEKIHMHIVFMIYYILFTELSPKKSVRAYVSTNDKNTIIDRCTPEYDKLLYSYSQNRKFKDEQTNAFFSNFDCPPPLYRIFTPGKKGVAVEQIEGHNMSELQAIQLSYINKYTVFDAIRFSRIQKVKSISNTTFEDEIFTQFNSKSDGIYGDILTPNVSKEDSYFMRSMNLFSIETNCRFEKNYHIAKAIKNVSKASDRKNEISIFMQSNDFLDVNHKYQDRLVLGYKEIMNVYCYPDVSAAHIFDIIHISNYIINRTQHIFFEENCGDLTNVEIPIDSTVEHFCKTFIGEGQHISEKNIEDIRVKDFRDLYNTQCKKEDVEEQ